MKTPTSRALLLGLIELWLCWPACACADALDHWHPRNQPSPAAGLNAIAFGNRLFVAVGTAGSPLNADAILTSTDGVAWTQRLLATTGSLRAVTCGDSSFVAVGGGGVIVTSPDGTSWSHTGPATGPDLYGMTWANGLFVAVGFDWPALSTAIVISPDATNWTRLGLEGAVTNSGILEGVAYGDGQFVAVSFGGGILTSTDGLAWTNRGTTGGFHRGVVYGNGTWVVPGGPEIFAGGATLWTGSDLLHWSPVSVPGAGPNYHPAVAFGNGTFVAVGNWGNISYSSDALAWILRDVGGNTRRLSGIAYGNGTFVAVGSDGTILQSDDVCVPQLTAIGFSDTGFRCTVSGEAGRAYRLQGSIELAAAKWDDLFAFTNRAGVTSLEDSTATNFSHRFYRVVSP